MTGTTPRPLCCSWLAWPRNATTLPHTAVTNRSLTRPQFLPPPTTPTNTINNRCPRHRHLCGTLRAATPRSTLLPREALPLTHLCLGECLWTLPSPTTKGLLLLRLCLRPSHSRNTRPLCWTLGSLAMPHTSSRIPRPRILRLTTAPESRAPATMATATTHRRHLPTCTPPTPMASRHRRVIRKVTICLLRRSTSRRRPLST